MPARARPSLTRPSLVMKGSPVRVRASALGSLAGLSSALATVEGGSQVRDGTSSDRFLIDEGVTRCLVCRHLQIVLRVLADSRVLCGVREWPRVPARPWRRAVAIQPIERISSHPRGPCERSPVIHGGAQKFWVAWKEPRCCSPQMQERRGVNRAPADACISSAASVSLAAGETLASRQ